MLSNENLFFPDCAPEDRPHPAPLPDMMPDCGFKPPKPTFTAQEEFIKTTQRVNETLSRVLKMEERVRKTLDNYMSTITGDNVAFKNLCITTYNTFSQTVHDEVNSFESQIENSYASFVESMKTDAENLTENYAKFIETINNAITDFELETSTAFEGYKAELNEVYNNFRDAIESRLEQHNNAYTKSFNDYVLEMNNKLTAMEKDFNDDYKTFVAQINESITAFQNEWTKSIDARLDGQDSVINDATLYMKTNLAVTLENLVNRMEETGELAELLNVGVLGQKADKTELNAVKSELSSKINGLESNKATKGSVQALEKRVSSIIANPSGAVDNTEIADARIDASGWRHDTLGDCLRYQFNSLAEQIEIKNLIDFTKLTQGYISAEGEHVPSQGKPFTTDEKAINHVYLSDFIKVKDAGGDVLENSTDYLKLCWYGDYQEYPLYNTSDDHMNACITISYYYLKDGEMKFIERECYWHNDDDFMMGIDVDAAYHLNDENRNCPKYVRISWRSFYGFNFVPYLYNRAFEEFIPYKQYALPDVFSYECVTKKHLIVDGYTNKTTGGLNSQSTNSEGVSYKERSTDYIKATDFENRTFRMYNLTEKDAFVRIAYFNANGEFMDYVDTSENYSVFEHTIPEDVFSVRFSVRALNLNDFGVFSGAKSSDEMYYIRECESRTVKSDALLKSLNSNIKAIAHRGYNVNAPENTIPAYVEAVKKGFEYAECDVQFTSDGVAVLLHDDTIDRTSNGVGKIKELTYNDVKNLDFGSWKNPVYKGTKIPTFEEFLKVCKYTGLKPYIELKAGTNAQIVSIVESVKKFGIKSATYVSFNAEYLKEVLKVDKTARVGFIASAITDGTITTINTFGKTTYKFEGEPACFIANQISEFWYNLLVDTYDVTLSFSSGDIIYVCDNNGNYITKGIIGSASFDDFTVDLETSELLNYGESFTFYVDSQTTKNIELPDVFINTASYTDSEVQKCIDANIPLEVWTINNANTILSLPVYVSGVTSDSLNASEIHYKNIIGG